MLNPNIEITSLLSPLIKTFKAISDETKNLLQLGLHDYLQSQTTKYFFTTTFLHRTEVRFEDIYFPLTASYKQLTTNFENLQEVFENYNNITLVGSAGSGKTTLIKYVFLNSLRSDFKIPILVELRKLNQFEGGFQKLIEEKILNSKIKPSNGILERSLESGKFLFLLDGYDEIFSSEKQKINRQIEDFMDLYPTNNFLMTTRPGSGIEGFTRFKDFKVNQLDNKQVTGFINKIVESDERKERILNLLSNPGNDAYMQYLRNPLLLSMFILAFESHPEIPTKKSSFYRNVFDTLYSKHDGITKNSFPREKLTKFDRDKFEKILNVFCYLTIINGNYSFTHELLTDVLQKVISSTSYECKVEDLIYDLQTTISILILDGFEYSFPHRSMQEYFAAQFLSNLPSESKERAYDNLRLSFEKSSNDYSFNLWSISLELDEIPFKKHFLIPELKKIQQKLLADNNYDLMANYLKLINGNLHFVKRHEKKYDRDFVFMHRINYDIQLAKFCTHFVSVFIVNRSNVRENLIKHFNIDPENYKTRNLKISDEVINILVNNGLHIMAQSNFNGISEAIKQYEKDIHNSNIIIDDLLKL